MWKERTTPPPIFLRIKPHESPAPGHTESWFTWKSIGCQLELENRPFTLTVLCECGEEQATVSVYSMRLNMQN